jgi:hypothetical protein
MAFTVEDFHDLVQLLGDRPEWRADLRRLVLSDELIELPALTRGLGDAQHRTETTVAALADAQRRTEAAVAQLVETQRGMAADLAGLRAAIEKLAETVGAMGQEMQRRWYQIDDLRGWRMERQYNDNAPAYFSRLVRRSRALAKHELANLLDDALDAGKISPVDRHDLLLADAVVRGRRWDDGAEIYLVVEVSVGVGPDDVRRAADRASALSTFLPAQAVVAGEWINAEERELASARGVEVVAGEQPQAAPAA